MDIAIYHVHAEICKGPPIEEILLAAEKVCSCDEILGRRNDRFSVLWRREIVLYSHQIYRFGPGFFGLWNVQVHLVAIKIRVVRVTHALVQTKCPPGPDFDIVAHDTEFV